MITQAFTDIHGQDHQVIRRDADISADGKYRWRLRREWRPLCDDLLGKMGEMKAGYVAWLMLNPSTADGVQDDPTIQRCMKFSASWGYLGMVVVNLYPFRSSSPADCAAWLAPWQLHHLDESLRVEQAMFENKHVIEDVSKGAALHMVASGADPLDMEWFDEALEVFERDGHPTYALGVGSAGLPLHPMARGKFRVPDSAQPKAWTWQGWP